MNGDGLSGWVLACLVVMTVSLLAMAIGQIALAIMVARTARQTMDALQAVLRDLKPIVAKAHKIADDAARATAIAVVQAERINQVTEMTARRIDETLGAVQEAVSGPLKQGAAMLAGIRAALDVFRAVSERRAPRDEDDALFVG